MLQLDIQAQKATDRQLQATRNPHKPRISHRSNQAAPISQPCLGEQEKSFLQERSFSTVFSFIRIHKAMWRKHFMSCQHEDMNEQVKQKYLSEHLVRRDIFKRDMQLQKLAIYNPYINIYKNIYLSRTRLTALACKKTKKNIKHKGYLCLLTERQSNECRQVGVHTNRPNHLV